MPENNTDIEQLAWDIASDDLDLAKLLKENPNLVTQRDKRGQTLLHCLDRIAYGSVEYGIFYKCMDMLLASDKLDLTIQDNAGNTPLHVAAFQINLHWLMPAHVLPRLVEAAEKTGYDFSIKNKEGKTALHIATLIPHYTYFGIQSTLITMLNNAKDPGINCISDSGSTALHYAITHMDFAGANKLLDKNADPTLGAKGRSPLNELEKEFKIFDDAINSSTKKVEDQASDEILRARLDKIKKLYKRITHKEFDLSSSPYYFLNTSPKQSQDLNKSMNALSLESKDSMDSKTLSR